MIEYRRKFRVMRNIVETAEVPARPFPTKKFVKTVWKSIILGWNRTPREKREREREKKVFLTSFEPQRSRPIGWSDEERPGGWLSERIVKVRQRDVGNFVILEDYRPRIPRTNRQSNVKKGGSASCIFTRFFKSEGSREFSLEPKKQNKEKKKFSIQ